MGLFDWLITPGGIELEHAIIVLLVAVAGYFARSARQRSSENAKLLNHHLEQHVMDAASAGHSDPGVPPTA